MKIDTKEAKQIVVLLGTIIFILINLSAFFLESTPLTVIMVGSELTLLITLGLFLIINTLQNLLEKDKDNEKKL